ncbi:tetratricopeptide repeat-containing sensor histidine kinase [Chryseobacterium sp. 2R14A]|uniref:tetratricopeptide repeat-containing sensor histidine kinase n=1 Tax=Chryseobacterium sp. 2R14A TaxID=3380353 RepID=UPI003CEDB127
MIRYLLFIFFFFFSCQEKKTVNASTRKGDNLYNEGTELLLKDDVKAYAKFQQAISYYSIEKDSSNISKSLICQAIAQKNKGDILGAESTLVEAIKLMKPNDESFYSVYDTMANLKLDQKEYRSAISWYNKALSEKSLSEENKINILCNKAAAEIKLGEYSKALNILESFDISKISKNNLKNRINTLTEYTKWLKNNNYPTEDKMVKILKDKLSNNDVWGANSSYSHLAEVTQETKPEKSLSYAKQMLKNAIRIKSPEDRLEAMERIFPVDNPHNLKENFSIYKTLSDSIQRSRNDYKKNFAYIKYDSEKKEIENQKLKAEKVEKEFQFYGISLFSLSLIIFGVIWYRKRKQRMQLESENKLKEQQLKVSKKVHDVVANGIYQVMTKIENQDNFNKEQALDELEFVYEKSRDISYEKPDSPNQNFKEKISNLIASFKNEEVNTFTAGNDEKIWENISESTQTEIYQVIRELLVNMKKHSKASNVALRFEKINNIINIYYIDNGIGISDELIFKNGLSNTVSRIENINGKITFDTKTEKGLKINILFPFS